MGEQQQIAGIDRHAEMIDGTTGVFDGGRDHIPAIGNRRGAIDQRHVAGIGQGLDFGGYRRGIVITAPFGDDVATQNRQPVGKHPAGLVEHLVGRCRRSREDEADTPRLQRRHAQNRLVAGCDRFPTLDRPARGGEGYDLDGGDQLACLDHVIGR